MNVAVKVCLKGVDPVNWAHNNNGPWPEHNLTALQVAVRHDLKSTVRHALSSMGIFSDLEIEVEVQ